ncbi:MAG: leucine-rich repeat domain-containing protein [Spirochaetaceae bacterium]|nr:leucine-rich repeat domain-containing protein [Spirochaetaceae bacterium]
MFFKKKLIYKTVVFSFFIYCFLSYYTSCGGGAGGASIPSGEYTTHNARGWGGGGGSSSGSHQMLQGGTPLNVTSYSYNGQTYSTIQELVDAIGTDAFPTGETLVSFTCTTANGGTETRSAKVTKSSSGNTIEHQYKATYTVNGTQYSEWYYRNDGISLNNLPPPDNTVYVEENGVYYHATGWTVAGQPYTGGALSVAPDSGDLDLGLITGGSLNQTYGFKSSGELVVNGAGTITIDNTGRSETITKITLPDSNVALDLSGVTNLNLSGTGSNPAITNGFRLTSITMPSDSYALGDYAFSGCSSLDSIDLSNCTSLGQSAFRYCSNLHHVTLGNLSSIPNYAFSYCPLQEIDFSNCSSFTIGEEAFSSCFYIDGALDLSNCTSIGEEAFEGCNNIDSVTFGNNVTIGNEAFHSCSGIGNVTFGTNTSIGQSAFQACSNLNSIDLTNCIALGEYAFQSCSGLGTVTLGNNITEIPEYAFDSCASLSNIDLSLCTSISNAAFFGCLSLGDINLSSCETIGNSAFSGCTAIGNVTFGTAIDSIASYAFENVPATFHFVTNPESGGNTQYEGNHVFKSGVYAYYNSRLYIWSTNLSCWVEQV